MNYAIGWTETWKKNHPFRYWIERLNGNNFLTLIVAIAVIMAVAYLAA